MIDVVTKANADLVALAREFDAVSRKPGGGALVPIANKLTEIIQNQNRRIADLEKRLGPIDEP